MACPSRRPDHPLTRGQNEQLALLLAAGAASRETAKGPFDLGMRRCNANIIGALRDKGLADSRVVRAGQGGSMSGQFTAYWLTEAGLAAARAAEVLA